MAGLITPLIVCGGSGSRLLPISRETLPKQFVPLFGEYSTFQETVLRVSDPSLFAPPIIVTHRDYQGHVERQLHDLRIPAEIVLEPERRGSGPAILAGAIHIAAKSNDAVLALAADHVVRDVDGFRRTCGSALAVAETGVIVTFGIVPDHPATGYGYIEPGAALSASAHSVSRFVEKPDEQNARRYVKDGFLWNSGNFLFRASTLVEEYRRFDVATVDAVSKAVQLAAGAGEVLQLDGGAFARSTARSIDYAVMEKTARAAVVRAEFDWMDIGSWAAIHRLLVREGDIAGSLVKSLTLPPNAVLVAPEPSRQAEYWIVAEGAARIGGARLDADEFAHLPAGAQATIANIGEGELRIVRARANHE